MNRLAAFVVSALVVFAGAAAPGRAHAADVPSGESVLVAAGYVIPIGCSAITGTYSGAYLAFGEGAPQNWRTAAYVCGGLSIGIGAYVLLDDSLSDSTVVGVVPIVVGSTAVLLAILVGPPDDVVGNQARVTPWIGPGGGGLAWSGSF